MACANVHACLNAHFEGLCAQESEKGAIAAMTEDVSLPWRLHTYVRVRPVEGAGSSVCRPEHRLLYLTDPTKSHQSHEFVFDQVFNASAAQGDIFEQVSAPPAVVATCSGSVMQPGHTGHDLLLGCVAPEVLALGCASTARCHVLHPL